jgi:fucose permease
MIPLVTPLTICGAFVFGIVLALLGSLKLTLVRKFEIRETQIGALLSLLNLAMIPMVLVAGILLDEMGIRTVMVIGALGTAAGLYFAGLSTSMTQTAASILVIGAGSSFLSVASVVLMQAAFYPENPAASQNLGNVFFGLGALVTPTLLELMLRRMSYQRTLAALAGVSLLPGVLALLTDGSVFPAHSMAGSLTEVFHSKAVLLTGLVFLLYGPLEWLLNTWSTTFLTGLGMNEHRSAIALSAFWLSFLAARLAAAYLMSRDWITGVGEAWFIIGLAFAAGITLGHMIGARSATDATFSLMLIGVCLGPIFPTLVGILFEFMKVSHGTAYGAMYSLGSLGGLILPPFMGLYAMRRTVRVAFRVPMVLAILMAVVALVLVTEWGF